MVSREKAKLVQVSKSLTIFKGLGSFMVERKRLWLLVRGGILFVAFIQGLFFMNSMPGDFSKPVWSFFVKMTAMVGVVVTIGLSLQMARMDSGEKWLRPSWSISPFNVRQPLIVFDFASYFFLVMGVGCFVSGILHENLRWMWELPAAVGLGAFIGVRAVMFLYKNSFE